MTTGKQVRVAPAFYDEKASVVFGLSPLTRMRRVCRSLAEASSTEVSDDDLVQRLQDVDAMVTQLQAMAADDLLELRKRRVAGQTGAGMTGPAADEDGWMISEVGIALALSDSQVHERIAVA